MCKEKKMLYQLVSSTQVYFRCPSNIGDFVKWQRRNYQNKILIQRKFSKLLKSEYDFPRTSVLYFKLLELLKNPLGGLTILVLGIYCAYLSKIDKTKFNVLWDMVDTTKMVNNHVQETF